MGLAIDLGSVLYLIVIPLLGFARGLHRELVMLAASLCSLGAGWLLRAPAAALLESPGGLNFLFAAALGFPAAFFACYAVFLLVTALAARGLLQEPPSPILRLWGGVVGLLEAGVMVGVLLTVLSVVPGTDGSLLVRAVAATGLAAPVAGQPGVAQLARLWKTARNPEQIKSLAARPEIREIVQSPAVQNLVHDTEIRRLIENRDAVRLLNHPAVDQIFRDPEFRRRVEALDLDRLLRELPGDTAGLTGLREDTY